jgi:RNA polymerase sigma-70 factor (sigma-E family)
VTDEAAFRAFVDANGAVLLHAARLLTGDHHRGEDLVQTALTRLYLHWEKVEAPLAYTRKALVTAHIDSTRRRWWGEKSTEVLPEQPAGDETSEVDERDELRRLLATLTKKERAVVVLRYYCDLSEQETAESLGMPVGTVKSTSARALARLRVDSTVGGSR